MFASFRLYSIYPLCFFSQASYEFGFANTTWLRRNPLYYQFYCVGLNTVFASLAPLLALVYLNVATLLALKRIGQQV